MINKDNLIIAIPKGRILEELKPLFKKINFIIENDFYNESSRKLVFSTNISNLKAIKVRSFDIATFVNSGKVDLGICGIDVIEEFSFTEIYSILNLNIGKCRISLAGKNTDFKNNSFLDEKGLIYKNNNLKIATKYINLAKKYCHQSGMQANIIKLNGSIEIAPHLGLCDLIIDLVSSGNTLKENNMKELEIISNISSYFIANKHSFKTKNITEIINLFKPN